MRAFLLLLPALFLFKIGSAQRIHGLVFSETGDLLPYSSITLKGTTQGSSANNRAKFSIQAAPGTYTLVCQHIGYAAQEKKVVVGATDEEITFVLKVQKLDLKEVVIKSNGEDPAYAIIRKAIKKRAGYAREVKSFSCDLYSKDMIKLRKMPKKLFGQPIEEDSKKDMGLDTTGAGIIYLSEAVSSVYNQLPDKFKMEVKSSRVSGSDGFGFALPAFISLYNNNVTIFTQKLNPRGFISPISENAMLYYRYKFLGSFWEDGKEVSSIRIIPRRDYEPLFMGVINITEGDWRIHSVDLLLTRKSQLDLIDSLKLVQFHVPSGNDTWRVKNQFVQFYFNQFGFDVVGNFVNVYSNYQINRLFGKDFFDNVVIKYDTGLNKKPRVYWDSIRPVPLEKEEMKDYKVKDSLFDVRKDSAWSERDIDSLKKKQGGINPIKIFWGGVNRQHYSKTNPYRWGIYPMIPRLEYNTAEGAVVNLAGYYSKYLKERSMNLLIEPNLRYGFSNGHLNGWVDVSLRTRNFDSEGNLKRYGWNFSAGSRVSQFNPKSPISPLINSISTLFYAQNYLKNYENVFATTGYTHIYESGLKVTASVLYEDRKPLNNTTNFTFKKKDSLLFTPNYPAELIQQQFDRHQAFLLDIDVSFKPGQKYIQFPKGKVAIGSKYPTLQFQYTKGINGIFGSDVNYDKWRFSIFDELNLKLAGSVKYRLSLGGFFNTKAVPVQDYQHFNGNLTVAASEYVNSFQMASYYAKSTTASFYVMAHVEHHFNGMLTNKIPLFRKLNWNLVAGTNTFYVDKNSNHIEVFAGLENIFKLLRVDFVAAFLSERRPMTGIRIGMGGLIGGSFQNSGGKRSVTLSF